MRQFPTSDEFLAFIRSFMVERQMETTTFPSGSATVVVQGTAFGGELHVAGTIVDISWQAQECGPLP